MEELLCTKCYEIKPLDEFPNKKNGRSGKSWYCKKCTNEYYAKYRKYNSMISDDKLLNYFKYKLQLIKIQDKKKFPDYVNTLKEDDLLSVYKKYNGKCVYSNKKLKPGSKVSIYAKISFDRIDNDLPHTPDNLQLTSVFMNMLRNGKKHSDFCNYIKSCE